jgi:exosome complex component RRP42
LTALISSQIPEGKWENGELEWTGKYLTGKTIVNELPMVITYGKIGDVIFLDPSLPEELVCDGKISISVTDDKITSIQKSGYTTFSIEDIEMLSKRSMEIGNKYKKELNLWQYKH